MDEPARRGSWRYPRTDSSIASAKGRLAAARIDQGGSLLFRARAGRKPPGGPGKITEWDGFADFAPKVRGVAAADRGAILEALRIRARLLPPFNGTSVPLY